MSMLQTQIVDSEYYFRWSVWLVGTDPLGCQKSAILHKNAQSSYLKNHIAKVAHNSLLV